MPACWEGKLWAQLSLSVKNIPDIDNCQTNAFSLRSWEGLDRLTDRDAQGLQAGEHFF